MGTIESDSVQGRSSTGAEHELDSGLDLANQLWRRHLNPGLNTHVQSSRIWRQVTQVGQVPIVDHVTARFGTDNSTSRTWDSLPFVMAQHRTKIMSRAISDVDSLPHQSATPQSAGLVTDHDHAEAAQEAPLAQSIRGTGLDRSTSTFQPTIYRRAKAGGSDDGLSSQSSTLGLRGQRETQFDERQTSSSQRVLAPEKSCAGQSGASDLIVVHSPGQVSDSTSISRRQQDGLNSVALPLQGPIPVRDELVSKRPSGVADQSSEQLESSVVKQSHTKLGVMSPVTATSSDQQRSGMKETLQPLPSILRRVTASSASGFVGTQLTLQSPIMRRVMPRMAGLSSNPPGNLTDGGGSTHGQSNTGIASEHSPILAQTLRSGEVQNHDPELVLESGTSRKDVIQPAMPLQVSIATPSIAHAASGAAGQTAVLRKVQRVVTPRIGVDRLPDSPSGSTLGNPRMGQISTLAGKSTREADATLLYSRSGSRSSNDDQFQDGSSPGSASSSRLVHAIKPPRSDVGAPAIVWRSSLNTEKHNADPFTDIGSPHKWPGGVTHVPLLSRQGADPVVSSSTQSSAAFMSEGPVQGHAGQAMSSINLAEMAEQVSRLMTRRLTAERERRGR